MIGLTLLITLSGQPVSAAPDLSWVTSVYRKGDFKLVSGVSAADILIASDDFKVVRLAADNLAMDVERVTGQKPSVNVEATRLSDHVVMVGTLGKSALIDRLVHEGKLDVTQLRGQWESFVIATVHNPLPNVSLGLAKQRSSLPRRGVEVDSWSLGDQINQSDWRTNDNSPALECWDV